MKSTIEYWINTCGATIEKKLGHTRDDLMNMIRQEIWVGLAMHDPTKKGSANKKTYIEFLIEMRFNKLLKQTTLRKYNTLTYMADVYSSTEVDPRFLVTDYDAEAYFSARHEMFKDISRIMNVDDRLVFIGLRQGYDIKSLENLLEKSNVEVIASINRIEKLFKDGRSEET